MTATPNRSVRHGTCFRRRLSAHHAGAAPPSAVAELGVVRRFLALPVNYAAKALLVFAALLTGCSLRHSGVSQCGDLGLGSRARLANPPDTSNLPFLQSIPRHPGFYFAPGERSFGHIDCRGFAPGTVLRSPYSQRLYRIPQ
jgi:hypothetical protein